MFWCFLGNTEVVSPIRVLGVFLFGWGFSAFFLFCFFFNPSLTVYSAYMVYHGLGNFFVLLVEICTWRI